MLKLTVKAGEYLLVGDNIKVVFTGGSANNLHVLVDAPRSMNIVRSTALAFPTFIVSFTLHTSAADCSSLPLPSWRVSALPSESP